MTRRLVAALAVLVALAVAGPAVAGNRAKPLIRVGATGAVEVVRTNFPDPGFGRFVDSDTGRAFFLYSTGMYVARSAHAMKPYAVEKLKAMPTRPRWVDRKHPSLWAPDVVQTATTPGSEEFTMYFSGKRRTSGLNCVGVAIASSPLGPFVAQPRPLICPPDGYWEAIDPSGYTDANGDRWLLYKIGDYTPRRFAIYATRVDDERGTTRVGAPLPILTEAQMGTVSAEAPQAVTGPDGSVWLFLSRRGYTRCNYATQAWSGPDLSHLADIGFVQGMDRTTGGTLCGAGGATVIDVGDRYLIAFHTRASKVPLVRPAWVDEVDLTPAGAVLH